MDRSTLGAVGDLPAADLAGLTLEHERATRRVADDDRVAVAHVGRERPGQPQHHLARIVEQAARLQRQAAAVLLWHLHLETVVLEDRDDLLALPRLVVLGAAAVEVDDPASGLGARMTPRPARDP